MSINEKYFRCAYDKSVTEGAECLKVVKSYGTHYCTLSIEINDELTESILIRSEDMVEHLHFMLGQMLRKSK